MENKMSFPAVKWWNVLPNVF